MKKLNKDIKSIFDTVLVRPEYLKENDGFSTNMSFYRGGLKYASITDIDGFLHQICVKGDEFRYYAGVRNHNYEKTRTNMPYNKIEEFKSILPTDIYEFLIK